MSMRKPIHTDEHLSWLEPAWLPGDCVGAFMTTRAGGFSLAPGLDDGTGRGGLNLGLHVNDNSDDVAANWQRLIGVAGVPVVRLQQIHGTDVHIVGAEVLRRHGRTMGPIDIGTADACVTCEANIGLAIMSADCLPVLIAARHGGVIGAAHAGWRGLSAGVLENTVEAMRALVGHVDELHAWIGVGIGPQCFEVGDDVREAFVSEQSEAAGAFRVGRVAGKWLADLAMLASQRLLNAGVAHIVNAGGCTFSDAKRFYSHRRQADSGRMAAVIWRRN